MWLSKGPFTTHFLLFFDHPPTHNNALAIILLMIYNTEVCYSNALANHPPTPFALRNMWTTPKGKAGEVDKSRKGVSISDVDNFPHCYNP